MGTDDAFLDLALALTDFPSPGRFFLGLDADLVAAPVFGGAIRIMKGDG